MEDNNDTVLTNGTTALDSDHWYVKGGIRQKWTPLGATVVYGDYAEYDDQLGPGALAAGATSSTLRRYGGGIAQELDCRSHDCLPEVPAHDGGCDRRSGTQQSRRSPIS